MKAAPIIEGQEDTMTIQISNPLSRSKLDALETIQQTLNQAGMRGTAEAVKQFDTDSSALHIDPTRTTSKGEEFKAYQTPIGAVGVSHHV